MKKLKINSTFNIDDKTMEEIKKLRTNITFYGVEIKIINVTSSVSREGKSTISFWLAHTLADSGKKVVYIDADLRYNNKLDLYKNNTYNENVKLFNDKSNKKHINNEHKEEGLNNNSTQSLVGYLSGKVRKEELLFDTDVNNLEIIISGEIPANPSELLSESSFSTLITYLRENYDYVIIDSPAVSEVTDGVIIAKHCDGSLLVVEPGIVPYKIAQKSKMQLELSKTKFLGVVLNKV